MAEKEYIERKKLLDALNEEKIPYNSDINYIITTIPAADVRENVKGEWIDDKGDNVPWDELSEGCPLYSCYCSVCGEWLTASDEYTVCGRYCPNCGAEMKGVKNG